MPADDLAIFVKGFRPDAQLVRRLVRSAAEFNVENIPLYLAVPDDEVTFFSNLLDRDAVIVIADSQFRIPAVTEKIHSFRIGYIEQQLIKLSLHKLDVARTYFVLDSDSFFIREFSHEDFLDESGRGYTVLSEDRDQFASPGYSQFVELRKAMIDRIADYLCLPPHMRATCHGNAILISDVLSSFEEWRRTEGLSLIDLMTIAPLEFSWYNFYLRKCRPDMITAIEPIVRNVHTRSEFRSLLQQGLRISALRRSYLGVCLNSGWAGRNQGRFVRKLNRGSMLAEARIRQDQMRQSAHRKIDLFRLDRYRLE